MRWLAATVALLGASAALVVGVYLRDRDPSNSPPPPRVAVSRDAVTITRQMRCPTASLRLPRSADDRHQSGAVRRGRVSCA